MSKLTLKYLSIKCLHNVYFLLDETVDGYEVTFEVEEMRRVSGGINTLIGTNDASLVSKFFYAVFCTIFDNMHYLSQSLVMFGLNILNL